MYCIQNPAQIGGVRKRYKVVPQPTTPKTYRYLGSIRKAKNLLLVPTCNKSFIINVHSIAEYQGPKRK